MSFPQHGDGAHAARIRLVTRWQEERGFAGRREGDEEFTLCDANYSMRPAAQPDGRSDDVGTRSEHRAPGTVTEDHHWRRSGKRIRRDEIATEGGPHGHESHHPRAHLETGEVAPGNGHRVTEGGFGPARCVDVLHQTCPRAPGVDELRRRVELVVAVSGRHDERHHAIAVGHREWLEQLLVDDAEDRSVRADAEGEQCDNRGGEERALADSAHGVADIH